MAFDINSFRSKFESYGGPARLSLFTLDIARPQRNGQMNPADIRMFAKSVTFPGVNLETVEHKPYAIGIPVRHPVGMGAQDLNAIFLMDSNHSVLSFFHNWIQDVYNFKATSLATANFNNPSQSVYEIGFHNEYTCDIIIRYYSTHNTNQYYECKLENAYPTQVGQIELSWDSTDQVATLPVSFAFDRISFSANRSGPVELSTSRSFGMIDFITSIGQIGQTVDSISKPKSVQDALNMFTNVAYTWDNIRSLF